MTKAYTTAMHQRDDAIVSWRQKGKTQTWIAEKKGLSVQRVRQILAKRAMTKKRR